MLYKKISLLYLSTIICLYFMSFLANSVIKIDPTVVQNMGIRTQKVIKAPLSHTIRTFGNLEIPEDEIKTVTIKYSGWVKKLFVDETGVKIEKNQPLFEIDSPELISTQEEFLLAKKNQE